MNYYKITNLDTKSEGHYAIWKGPDSLYPLYTCVGAFEADGEIRWSQGATIESRDFWKKVRKCLKNKAISVERLDAEDVFILNV